MTRRKVSWREGGLGCMEVTMLLMMIKTIFLVNYMQICVMVVFDVVFVQQKQLICCNNINLFV